MLNRNGQSDEKNIILEFWTFLREVKLLGKVVSLWDKQIH